MATNFFQTLKRWDVEFDISPEMLKSILEYMVSFKNELYMKLFNDRIFIQSKGYDGTQYTDINIEATGVQNYSPNIPDGLEERYKNFTRDEQIQYRNIYVTPEGVHKKVYLNLIDKNPTTPVGELLMFLGKNPVKVKIDTLVEKRIEFTVQRGMYLWWRLMDPICEDNKKAENMPAIIARIRNDVSVGKAVLTMEPGLFKRIASLGGKLGKTGNVHTRALFETDINKGLSIASGDNMRGRMLKLGVLGSDLSSYDSLGNKISDTFEEKVEKEKKVVEQPFVSPDVDIDIDPGDERVNDNNTDNFSDDDDEGYDSPISEGIDNDTSFTSDDEIPFMTSDDVRGRNKQDKNTKEKKNVNEFENDLKKKEKKKGMKEEETIMDESITNDLSSAEVEVKTQLWLEIPYLAPLLKLGGMSPIFIEMRNGKPLVVIQKPYPDMTVLLTVAPRIEEDDD